MELGAESPPTIYWQWPGEVGTVETLQLMRQFVNESYGDPLIKARAKFLVEGCHRDIECEHRILFGWVKTQVHYTYDPPDIETLKHPLQWIERRIREGLSVYGDCASLSMYLAALLKAIDHDPAFRVVGKRAFLHHVFVVCHGQNLDTTMGYGEAPRSPMRTVTIII